MTKGDRTHIVGGRNDNAEEDGIYLSYEIWQNSAEDCSKLEYSGQEDSYI